MKKLTLLLFVVILLTACQPAATPAPTAVPPMEPPPTVAPTEPPTVVSTAPPIIAPTKLPPATPTLGPGEALASSVDELIGKWRLSEAGVTLEIRADGTYRVYAGSDTFDEGNYTFEAGRITWVTGHPTCYDRPATYEAYVTKEDGKPAWLRLQVVGSDPCRDRADISALGRGKFQNP